jgi:hypothetical protein
MATPTIADDPAYQAYVKSLFSEPGKAQREFGELAVANPILTSYAVALFAERRCSTPKPSGALIDAAGGESAFDSEIGKKVFAVSGVVATMSFPTPQDEAGFCEAARKLIAAGEAAVAGQR